MSRHLASLVYRKQVGSMARKAILAYCADRANDDGSGIWASKARIAAEVECSKRTVIDTIKSLCADGIMRETGKRTVGHGFVVVYSIVVRAVEGLPDAIPPREVLAPISDDDGEDFTGADLHGCSTFTPKGEIASPQRVSQLHPNRPLTVLEPSISEGTDVPSSAQKPSEHHRETTAVAVLKPSTTKNRGTRLPRDWVLPRSWGEWALEQGFTVDAVRAEAENFRDYWISKAGSGATKVDWEATFRNWMRNSKTPRNGGRNGKQSQGDWLGSFVNGAD